MIHMVKAGQSIQRAIDAAGPGDTVLIERGVFTEQLRIGPGKAGLRVVAQVAGDTLLDGSGTEAGPGIRIEGSACVTLSGLVVCRFAGSGIEVAAARAVVEQCETRENKAHGVLVTGPENLLHCSTACGNRQSGVHIEAGELNVLYSCRLERNAKAGAFVAHTSSHALLLDNWALGNDVGLSVAGLGSVLLGNRSQGNRIGFTVLTEHVLLYGNESLGNRGEGLIVRAARVAAIRNRLLGNGRSGVDWRKRDAHENDGGLLIANQLCHNAGSGLNATLQRTVLLANLTEQNQHIGIRIHQAAAARVLLNRINRNGADGMHIANAVGNLIDQNRASENPGSGLRLGKSCTGNVLRSNRLKDNLEWDLAAEGDAARRNRVYMNACGTYSPDELRTEL